MDENKVIIGVSGAISPLVNLLRDGIVRGKKDAATEFFFNYQFIKETNLGLKLFFL